MAKKNHQSRRAGRKHRNHNNADVDANSNSNSNAANSNAANSNAANSNSNSNAANDLHADDSWDHSMEPLPGDPSINEMRAVESSLAAAASFMEGLLEYFMEELPCDSSIYPSLVGFNSPANGFIDESLDPSLPFNNYSTKRTMVALLLLLLVLLSRLVMVLLLFLLLLLPPSTNRHPWHHSSRMRFTLKVCGNLGGISRVEKGIV
jgi:hypothetical protein